MINIYFTSSIYKLYLFFSNAVVAFVKIEYPQRQINTCREENAAMFFLSYHLSWFRILLSLSEDLINFKKSSLI